MRYCKIAMEENNIKKYGHNDDCFSISLEIYAEIHIDQDNKKIYNFSNSHCENVLSIFLS